MRAHLLRTAVLAAATAALGACGAVAPRPASPAGTRRLAGVWDATFALDAPPLGFDSARLRALREPRVHGTLVLVPNHWLTSAAVTGGELPTAPTLYGTYDVDFRPFGFDCRDANRVPDVVVTGSAAGPSAGADSVTLVMNPSSDRVRVLLAGVTRGDTVVGSWRMQREGRAGATAGGRFVLVAPPAVAPQPAATRATLGARARGMLRRAATAPAAER